MTEHTQRTPDEGDLDNLLDETLQADWWIFESDYLTDGTGRVAASVRDACYEAFHAAWPEGGPQRAHEAAKSTLDRLLLGDVPVVRSTVKPSSATHLPVVAGMVGKSPETVPEGLLTRSFVIQHNPNCPSRWLVRLPGPRGIIDMKPYGQVAGFGIVLSSHETQDVLGFGRSLEEAAEVAIAAADGARRERLTGKSLSPVAAE